MGPQQSFLDWVEWRLAGAKKDERPRSVPRTIPKAWRAASRRHEQMLSGGEPRSKPPVPAPGTDT